MRPAVIAHQVAIAVLLSYEVRVASNLLANAEKCGLHPVMLENCQYLRCIVRVWAIIKGQRNLWEVTIAGIEEAVLRLERRYLLPH